MRTIVSLIFTLSLLFCLSCRSSGDEPRSWLGTNNWFQTQAKRQYESDVRDAREALSKGREAFAIGKLRSAYRHNPSDLSLPFQIAHAYAAIVAKNPNAEHEKLEAVTWLYRAKLVDPEWRIAALKEPPFVVLASLPSMQSLLGTRTDLMSDWSLRLERVTLSLSEAAEVFQEVKRFLSLLFQLADFVGVQVVAFLGCIFLVALFLRNIGLIDRRVILFFSFVVSAWFFQAVYRIATGGEDAGYGVVTKVVLWSALIYVFLRSGEMACRRLALEFRRFLTTRFFFSTWCQKRLSSRKKTNDEKSRRELLFHLTEETDELTKLLHRYFACRDELERQEIGLAIETLRQRLHEKTRPA